MRFTPRSEREIQDAMVLEPGVYDFEVDRAEEKISKKGNDMIELELRVFCRDGSTRLIRDWLVPSMELKLNRFCHATGLTDVYNAGELSAFACGGVSGRVKIGVEDTEKYGKQNRVKDYVVGAPPEDEYVQAPKETYEQQLAEKGDEIPF